MSRLERRSPRRSPCWICRSGDVRPPCTAPGIRLRRSHPLLGEGLRRGLNLPVHFTRKFVHIGVGMVAFLLVAVFNDWHFAIIPPLVFIVVNYVSYRRQIFAGMETGAKDELGTVYFPISFAILIPLLWYAFGRRLDRDVCVSFAATFLALLFFVTPVATALMVALY